MRLDVLRKREAELAVEEELVVPHGHWITVGDTRDGVQQVVAAQDDDVGAGELTGELLRLLRSVFGVDIQPYLLIFTRIDRVSCRRLRHSVGLRPRRGHVNRQRAIPDLVRHRRASRHVIEEPFGGLHARIRLTVDM